MPDSSTDCFPCRLEWRPSRWQAAGALLIWPLATVSSLATRWAVDFPPALQAVLVFLALGVGWWAARAHGRRPAGRLDLLPKGSARWSPGMHPDGPGPPPRAAIEGPATLHEQWPVTVVRFAARGPTLVFWPDTLCDSGRRELRRWARTATPPSPLPQFWMG